MKKLIKLSGTGSIILTILFLLVSCNAVVTFHEYGEKNVVDQFVEEEISENHYRPAEYLKNYSNVLRSSRSIAPLESKGVQKMLVLPVNFTDFDLNTLDGNNGESAHINIQNAFFGENKETVWRSVTGFYHESSYGQLLIQGEVAPWYQLTGDTYKVNNLRTRSVNDKLKITQDIVNAALLNYQNTFGVDKLAEFDGDDDGQVDSIYVIYSAPYENKDENNLFWAFAANMSFTNSGLSKQANAYAWSSYYYANIKRNHKPDAHTYIHETGHILGLNDYYDTNYATGRSPLGGWDMMDYALGDHTGFSKMLLNWTTPIIPTKSGSFTLRPFTTSGDLMLLANNWNQNATDEYILLEYYAPVGLNELDTKLNAYFKLPNAYGIKVYHVDARLAYYANQNREKPYVYEDDYVGNFSGTQKLAHSNSTGEPYNSAPFKDFNLYKLLEASESGNISQNKGTANIFSLFTVGDDFGYTHFTDFTFNTGASFDYKFIVKSISKTGVVIDLELQSETL